MALEPRTATLDESNPELEDMSRRFWFAAGLTMPLVLVAMSEMLPGRPLSSLLSGRMRVNGDLRGIARALRLSRETMSNIRQNLFFALVYNAAGVPIAAGVLSLRKCFGVFTRLHCDGKHGRMREGASR